MASSPDQLISRLTKAWLRAQRLPKFLGRQRRTIEPYLYRGLTSVRWGLQSSTIARHGLPKRLIVSLTSFPPRFGVLPLTLKCLLMQSVRPDALILWIAHEDLPHLTPKILSLQGRGLEIRSCTDTRSFKKIVPALEVFPDSFIVTADDDVYYPPTWLEELVSGYDGDDHTVLCHRAHRIRIDKQGSLLPYNDWEMEIRDQERSPYIFPTSGGGVLYPPGILPSETLDSERFLDYCPTADDVWLYWMVHRNGGQARRISKYRVLITWPDSQQSSLWNTNRHANDHQIQNMITHFGIPDLAGP